MASRSRLSAALAVAALVAATSIVLAPSAGAAVFEVTNTNDAGAGSLRAAVAAAAANAGDDTVVVQAGLGTIVATGGTIDYPAGADGALRIEGNGLTADAGGASTFLNNASDQALTVDAMIFTGATSNALNSNTGALTITNSTFTGNERVANNNSASLTISDSLITGNLGTGDPINTASGALTITRTQIVDNAGTSGNTASGTVTITDSLLSGNRRGFNSASGPITVVRSTISDNDDRGINTSTGAILVTGSTISGNGSDFGGAGIRSGSGPITLVNSTVSGNIGADEGAIESSSGDVSLVYATVARNSGTTGANVAMGEGTLRSFGSVIAQPAGGGENCAIAAGASNGHNFSDDASCVLDATGDTMDGGDPLLGALAENGGPTETHLPAAGSPLLDAIPLAACQDGPAAGVIADQRGVTRPQGSGCDIGAVEVVVEEPPEPVGPTTSTTAPPAAAGPVALTPRFTG